MPRQIAQELCTNTAYQVCMPGISIQVHILPSPTTNCMTEWVNLLKGDTPFTKPIYKDTLLATIEFCSGPLQTLNEFQWVFAVIVCCFCFQVFCLCVGEGKFLLYMAQIMRDSIEWQQSLNKAFLVCDLQRKFTHVLSRQWHKIPGRTPQTRQMLVYYTQ